MSNPRLTILMITIGYPPDQVGGTEVYVHGLVEGLSVLGHTCHIAYLETFQDATRPGVEVVQRAYQGTEVHVVRVNTACHRLERCALEQEPRGLILSAFLDIVGEVHPDVVHVHPLTLGLESHLIDALRAKGVKVVLTYHSSNTACARGDLVYLGREVCDGRIDQRRCTRCLYHHKGVALLVASGLARLPLPLFRLGYRVAGTTGLSNKLRSFFSIPLLIEAQQHAWSRATRSAAAVVAVCRWVREVIARNGVPPQKVILARHGLRIHESPPRTVAGIACLGYLGRVSPEKGIGVLLDALEGMPRDLDYRFEFCSSTFDRRANPPDVQNLVDRVERLAAADGRVAIRRGIADGQLAGVLAGWDALVVPSLWLESGPQVIYEAFAVRTPVIGSDRGGIRELVEHGRTGFLLPPNDSQSLRAEMERCSRNPGTLRELSQNIGAVRTTKDVAEDMASLYRRVCAAARVAECCQSECVDI